MKKLIILLSLSTTLGFAQTNSTGTVALGTLMTVKIDTNPTTVTLTLTGPSDVWFGIGFGGLSMSTANDMFIYNSTTNRDYTSVGQAPPTIDAGGSQSWVFGSDIINGSTRTVVYSRPLMSSGDYTFLNNNSSIPVVYAFGTGASLAFHAGRSSTTLSRAALGVEDFSLNASSIAPNPSSGSFTVKSKTGIETIDIYSQTGAFIKTVKVDNGNSAEVNVEGLSTGVYLVELKNKEDKSWKKVVIK